MVSTRTGRPSWPAQMSLTSASPSPSSSARSVMTKSGREAAIASSPACGVATAAQTMRSDSLSISTVSPRRTSAWLSTIRIRRLAGASSAMLSLRMPTRCRMRAAIASGLRADSGVGDSPMGGCARSAAAAGLNPLRRALGQFGSCLEAQLVLDVLAVGFDRLDAQVQGVGDLACAPALTDQPEHLQLAVAERVQGRVRFQRSPIDEFRGEPRAQRVAHVRLAVEQPTDGNQHGAVELLLGDIAPGAGFQGTLGINRFVVHREHQRRYRGMTLSHLLDQVQAVTFPQREIDDHQVG